MHIAFGFLLLGFESYFCSSINFKKVNRFFDLSVLLAVIYEIYVIWWRLNEICKYKCRLSFDSIQKEKKL